MQDATRHQMGPHFPGDVQHGYVPHYVTGPTPRSSLERFGLFLLGTLVIILSISLILGGLYARSEINEQESAALGFQEEAGALAVERDELSGNLQAALADSEDMQSRLDAALADAETAEADLQTAIADLESAGVEAEEQERLLSQAREETARQQELAGKLNEIVLLDNEIHWLFVDFIDLTWVVVEAENDQVAMDAATELDYVADDLIALLELREELLADL
jgi:chromosome segregation ATPase